MRLFLNGFSWLWVALMSVLTLACTPAAPPSGPTTLTQTSPSEDVPLAGGWSQADPFAPEVQEAARFGVQAFAVQSQTRILYKDVVQARQQVVAGLNFQLHLKVMQDGTERMAQATVWRQPDGVYKLLAWVWLAP